MKNAQFPEKEEPSAPNSANSTSAKSTMTLTPREARAMSALQSSDSWISREAIDRIAGASNGPQIILQLRRKVTGHDGIEMQKANARDRDGRVCKPGRYRLTALGRQRVANWSLANG